MPLTDFWKVRISVRLTDQERYLFVLDKRICHSVEDLIDLLKCKFKLSNLNYYFVREPTHVVTDIEDIQPMERYRLATKREISVLENIEFRLAQDCYLLKENFIKKNAWRCFQTKMALKAIQEKAKKKQAAIALKLKNEKHIYDLKLQNIPRTNPFEEAKKKLNQQKDLLANDQRLLAQYFKKANKRSDKLSFHRVQSWI